MLVDLPHYVLEHPRDPLLALMRQLTTGSSNTTRLAKGVYEAHLNWEHELRNNGVELNEYPFDPLDAPNISAMSDEQRQQFWAAYEKRPRDYGVCDSWEQLLERWPEIESDARKFVIHVTRMRRDEQSPEGGWRWHKWGEYIGTQDSQCEYLYDEPEIEQVFVFHIYEVFV